MADVVLEGITKRFGPVIAVNDLSLKINDGEFLFLLGPSGCGKTTLLRTIAGFEHPDAGRLYFGGKEATRVHPSKRNIGMVFQNYALFPHMTVYQNVGFGLKVRRVDEKKRRERVMRALDLVKLVGLEKRYPLQLSGGQQQRAALARAIVIDPDILLLDEPFGALDRKLRVDMQLELKLLQKKLKITTVFVTHDQEEALTMSDRIAVMRDGLFEQVDTPMQIYERPASEFVASFIGATNLLQGRVESLEGNLAQVRTASGLDLRVAAPQGASPGLAGSFVVRPEKIHVGRNRLANYDNTLPGKIENILYMGEKTHYYVAVPGKTLLVFEQNLSADPALYDVGSPVFVHFDCRSVLTLSLGGPAPLAVEGGRVQSGVL